MYELRGNSGGDVRFADKHWFSLFKPDFEPFGDCYLMNQITYNLFVDGQDPNVDSYAKGLKRDQFPFSKEFASGSTTYTNALSVGFTKTVRTGRHNGQDIEDVGIEPDIVVRPQWSDLQPDSPTNTQYDRIAASLARIGQENGQSKLNFVCEPFSIEKPINGFSLEVEAAGIEKFTVFQDDGVTVAAKKGKQVLKTNRNVRTISTNDNYMKISTREFIFEGISDSVGLYQSSTTASGDGWNNLKGPWMIGNGIKYASNGRSSIEAFFIAPIDTEVNIGLDIALDTETDCDFLYLSVKSRGGVEDFLLRSKNRDGTKTFNGISGMKHTYQEELFPSPQSPKSFLFLSSLPLMRPRRSLVLLSNRSLSLLLEIFRLVEFDVII
ncbi:hypothetical protein BASA81_017867 [Batrachochytrium salamandrivorans]|nr:hypothetical protein BASA81_017867 [Batrachochytrium salamandrivorans]